ncbi:MAG TPA: protein kinase, partial [Planctomycetota bacterium]|nr:protein kinase [Planctomycetota bacterium]
MGSEDRGPGDDSEGGAETDHLAERLQNALSREGSPSQNAEAGATRTTSDDLLLGRLALESGLITPEQLGEAIAHQNNAKAPDGGITLGQYFLREKWITPEALARLLAEDAHRAQQVPDLPRYEIRSLVGQGATALVYSAWDRDLRRLVALKLLRETTALGETARARFRREAQVAAGLSHPNVIAVHDAGEVNGQLYLVMELVEGRPLGEVLRDPGVDRSKKLSLLEQVAQGVAAAHGRGIIHRDLKPANILVTAQGLPKVGDFGLAHLVDSSTELTKTGATLGTPLYMSPEQVEGRSEDLSPATDVYALGAILYEIVAGRPPHTGETTMEIYRKIVHDEPLAPSKIDPGLPADLETIILKAIDKDHRRRYGTAEAFAGDLGRHLRGEPIQGKRLPWGALLLRRARRHKGALIAGIALTTLALAAVGALSSSARKKHRIESAIARALLFEREARYLEASTLLRSTLEEDPLNERARTSLGRVVDLERRDQKLREDRDRREKKAAAILEAVRPALGEAEHYSYDPKATSEGLGQRLGALRTRIREAMEMAPSLPLTHYLLGHSFEIAEEDEPAEESTLQALKIDPEFSAARYQLGRIYLGRALKRMIGTTPEEIELKKGEARELAERAAGEIEKALTRETAFEDNLHRELARTTLAYLTGPRLRALELAERGFKQFPQKDGREEFLWIAGLASSGG